MVHELKLRRRKYTRTYILLLNRFSPGAHTYTQEVRATMYKLDMTILIVISSNDGRRQLPAAAPQPRVAWARARYVVKA